MRVTIIGAGPGGLAAALGLISVGHEVHVHERAASLRLGGAAVTLWPNGTAVLAALGVPVDGLGPVIDVLDGRTGSGRPLLRMGTARLSARFATPTLSVPRRVLVQRLSDALPAGTVTFSRTCTGVDPTVGRVTFTDGTSVEADVVVGADGRTSGVRQSLAHQGLRPDSGTRPTGWVTWQGLSPVPIEVTGSHRILTMLGRAGFVGLQPAGDGLLQWYFSIPPDPDPGAGPPASPVAMLRERFAAFADPVPDVLAAIDDADIASWAHHTQPVSRTWGVGRVTMLGDAAHTMPPSLAQGVNQTLEDAHALTRALTATSAADAGDPAPLLRRYEATRARQVRRIAAMAGSESSTTYRPSTQLLMRAVPDRLAAATYAHLIEASSSVLRR